MQWSQREKLFHAMVFFLENTKHCHKLKLLKLLYAFDFEIFRQTGSSATELAYFAWPMGPVAPELFRELDAPPEDMKNVFATWKGSLDIPNGDKALQIKPKIPFDADHFSKRELRVMNLVAEVFRDATAPQMTEASHQRGDPWHQVYKGTPQGRIPYILALDARPIDKSAGSISREQAEEIELEAREAAALFK